jgi:protein-S-isoprenylcysteine O-methyltransferase Ste14
MTKFLNKWTRKIHRWIAIPTAILIPIAVILKFTGDTSQHFPPQIEQFQSILMLLLAISGTYLFLITYIAKWQRSRRKKAQETANRETGKQQKVLQ